MIWEIYTLLVEGNFQVQNTPHGWLCNLEAHYYYIFNDVEPQFSFSLLTFFIVASE